MFLWQQLSAFLLLAGTVHTAITPCSYDDTDCECDWIASTNRYKMECDRTQLARVPKLNNAVEELHMYRTSLDQTTISQESFREATNLRIIEIRSCGITSISVGAFNSLYSVKNLSLASNKISSLPERVFSDLSFLQKLDLQDNSLESLTGNVFEGLSNLNILDLSFNSLTSLPTALLRHLKSLKVFRLENALMGVERLPNRFLSHNTMLEELSLNDNKIKQLQPELLVGSSRSLRVFTVTGNKIASVPAQVFESLTRLVILDMKDNPFVCNCRLLSYKEWIDNKTSKGWTPQQTGSCSSPAHLQGEHISTLRVDHFECRESSQSSTSQPTGPQAYKSTELRGSSGSPTRMTSTPSKTEATSTVHKAAKVTPLDRATSAGMSKSLERALIIGCSIGGAFLLIVVNVMIVCCVRANRHTGSRKIKYIIRPDELEVKEGGDEYATPYKQATVDGTGNGYIISNGVSGYYYAGSRSRLHSVDQESAVYDTAPQLPPKLECYLQTDENDKSNHDNSIFHIPMTSDMSYKYTKDLDDLYMEGMEGSYYVPNMKYHSDWEMHPGETLHDPVNQEVNDSHCLTQTTPHGYTTHTYNIASDNYLHIEECADIESGEFITGRGPNTLRVKFSAGSTDSGVHSNSPYVTGVDNVPLTSSPYLTVVDDIHPMTHDTYLSPNSKKIRNETYV